jgi:PAS domain S-box-containing protein
MNAWRRFFDIPSTDPDDARRRRLLVILILGVGSIAFIAMIAALLGVITIGSGLSFYLPIIAIFVGCAIILAINYFGPGWLASGLFLSFLVVVITFSDDPEEVVAGRSLYAYVLPTIMASVLLRSYGSFIFVGLSEIAMVGLARSVQITPDVPAMLGFWIIGTISWLASRSLEHALADLRALNRELDQRVADRTRELREALTREQAETSKNQAILQSIADGVLVFDPDGRATVANQAATRLFERPASRLVGNDIDQLMGSGVSMAEQIKVRTMLKSDAPAASPLNVQWGGKTLSLSVAPVRVASGEAAGAVAVLRDVTREAEVSRMKSAFVSMVSHELRTPLNAIQGYAEILQQNVHGPLLDKQRGFIERIMTNTGRLLTIVGDLLDQAQIEAGTLAIRDGVFTPAELVESVQSSVGVMAQKKGVGLLIEVEPEVPKSLVGDSQRLYQVLSNLTTNAIKYTDHGQITIRFLRPDPDHWAMQVDDTGAGIPISAEPYIFEPFRQVDDTISRRHGGVGLGLAIVKRLVELMNGEIRLSSRIGRGSTFTVIFPLVAAQPVPEPA